MKQHVKVAGLCLIAIFAINATASVTASAAPEKPYWDQCSKTTKAKEGWYTTNVCKEKVKELKEQGEFEKVEIEPGTCVLTQELKTGAWNDAKCEKANEKHEGEFEWVVAKHKFTSKQIGESILETEKNKIKCTEGTNEGEKTGPQHFVVTIRFKKCKVREGIFEGACGNQPGAKSEEIVTSKLEGTLVYSPKGTTKPAALLTVKAKGENFASFECEVLGVKAIITVDGGPTQTEVAEEAISGSCILAKLSPANEFTKTGKLVFEQTGAAQELKEFEFHKKVGGKCELEIQVEKEGKKEKKIKGWEKTTDEVTFEDATNVIA
jgi:hypothetical protein